MALVLHGFGYSVYVRIARIALAEKCLTYEHVEIIERKRDCSGQHALIKRLENQVRGRLGEQIILEKDEVDWEVE